MIHNDCALSVLVKGRPITEYFHRGQTFVEGRDGSNYEIEFHNRTGRRVEVVLSVDGLSVTDGQTAGLASSGYLVEPRATLRVPGWKVDGATAAAFAFAGQRGAAYVEQAGGDARNRGVIGALVFCEQPPVPLSHWTAASSGYLGNCRGITPQWTANAAPRGIAASAYNACQYTATATNAYVGSAGSTTGNATDGGATPEMFAAQSLGTAFGAATEFATTTVQFQRGDMLAMLTLYYDNLRGLKARGIPIERRPRTPRPEAFPGLPPLGCPPPPGWRRD